MSEPTPDLEQGEKEAVAFHNQVARNAVDLWVEGFNLLLRGLDPLAGHKVQHQSEHVMVALLIAAMNNIYCAFKEAYRGFYPQSMNLLRTPIEYWMSYWYLRNFPDDHLKFANLSEETPKFNDMLQRVESNNGLPADKAIRAWIRSMHTFSHVDRLVIRMVLQPGGKPGPQGLGPGMSVNEFARCTHQATTTVIALADALNNLRLLTGKPELSELAAYTKRQYEWTAKEIERLGGDKSD